MRSTSVLPCIMTMISNFTISFIFQIFIFKFFCTDITDIAFPYDSSCSFVNNFFIACSKESTKLFHTIFTSVHIMFIFYALNDDIVDIEKPDGICSVIFIVSEFSGLFLQASIFSLIHPRSA